MSGCHSMNVVILGSTGSIGIKALDVARRMKDRFRVVGLSAYSNMGLLKRQVREFSPLAVCVGKPEDARLFSRRGLEVFSGNDGLSALAGMVPADVVLIAVVGAVGIYPLLAAVKSGRRVALANKESMVIAGGIVRKMLSPGRRRPAERVSGILPVDSEHSAIFQCISGEKKENVKRLILTGSGGPFYRKNINFDKITVRQALDHPNWKMGKKITVDSSTLMNKGLEVIEARHLFDIPFNRIDVLIHPQSIVHSMVEFSDGAVLGLMSVPDMKLSIQYALTYPERYPTGIKSLKLDKIKRLEFFSPDFRKFRCLSLAIAAGKEGNTMPAVLNASNEVAVQAFLQGRIRFSGIPAIIEETMEKHTVVKDPSPDDVISADGWARKFAGKGIN